MTFNYRQKICVSVNQATINFYLEIKTIYSIQRVSLKFRQDKSYEYLHQFAVFFNKILIKYIFGIMEYSSFGILNLRIIILDSRMGVFSTKYIILLIICVMNKVSINHKIWCRAISQKPRDC